MTNLHLALPTNYRRSQFAFCCLLRMAIGFSIAWALARPLAADPVDFARDIRPILADRCFTCHGPDAEQRVTQMRLDVQSSAHEFAIVAEKSNESELIKRIESSDSDEVMPPPDAKLVLSDSEKALLKQWIDEGGEYSEHWAFVAPRKTELPQVNQTQWPRNAIDFFVLRGLEKRGWTPAQPANAETLLRRLSLDLNGIPPTPEEVDAFVAQSTIDPEAAYVSLVDRLLASPRLGERWATDWLDVSRYADTYGYQADRYRAMWPWRDWVIKALNENLSYDQFITWQLAGDLLPDAAPDQVLATAFNRNHRQTNEGGSVEEEYRVEYVADRVNTFGSAFLGLTLECCRCHDHKYDPLTQAEYYQLSAFFNSIDESGLYSHFTDAVPTPTLRIVEKEQVRRLEELRELIRQAEQQRQAFFATDEFAQQFDEWRSGHNGDSLAEQLSTSLSLGLIGDYPLDDDNHAGNTEQIENRVQDGSPGKSFDSPQVVPGKIGRAMQFSGENNVSFQSGGDFTRNQPFTISLWLQVQELHPRAVVFHRSRAWTDSGSRGYELLLEEGRLSAALVHFWPGNAIRVRSLDTLPINQWVHVAMRYDGSSSANGLQLFVNGRLAESEIVKDALSKHIYGSDGAGGDVKEISLAQRFRDVGLKNGMIDEFKVFSRDVSDLEIRALASPELIGTVDYDGVADSELRDYFLRTHPQWSSLEKPLRELRDSRSAIEDPLVEIMAMRELPEPRKTFVLQRGAYDAPGKQVSRQVPQALTLEVDIPSTAPNRLDLAKWLVDPRHPLTARVAVNRFWQSLFGTGLVATAEDFGLQGQPPSHPELLDWLSQEFVHSSWDVKRLLKTIVMSSTYRQASDPRVELLDADPENRWLARGAAFRLPAEMIRDAALSASGLMAEVLGGQAMKPYQPDGLWEEKSGTTYQRDIGAGSYRRSVYTFWKRTSPPPSMMTFDASNREVCMIRRQTTMTPLQTLVVLNDPQYVEAARALAARELNSSGSGTEQTASGIFCALASRQPSKSELAILVQMFQRQLELFQSDPTSTAAWLSAGDYRAQFPAEAQAELAAWSVVAGGLMSYDEMQMKR